MSKLTPVEPQSPARRAFFSADGEPTNRVTPRSVVIGLAFTAAIAFVTPYSDLLMRSTWMACSHLPMAPLLAFMVLLTVVNTLLKKASPDVRSLMPS